MNLLVVVAMLVSGNKCVEPNYVPPLQEWDGPSYRVIEVRPELIEPLRGLFNELESYDVHPVLLSGYRSYERQADMHQADPEWTEPASCSQHQLGTAVDIVWMGTGAKGPYRATSARNILLWGLLAELGPKYGLTVTYDGTGDIPAEPWHLNYQLVRRIPWTLYMYYRV